MKIKILNFSGSRGQLLGVYWSSHSRSSALVQVIVRENGRSEWWFQLSRKESPTLSFLWKTLGFERLLVFSLEFFNAYKNLPIGAISFLKYYRSLPPVSKVYGVACLLTTTAYYLQLYSPWNIALSYELVFKRFQVWRLVTNFFFLGPFSFSFAFRLLIIARYGVALERWSFDERTADYVWMLIFGALSLLVMAVVPYLWSRFMGASLVFMIFYVWGREFPNAQINFHGLVSFKGFYLPWIYLAVDLLLGNPLKPDILGMVAGHLYYFLTVLHPLAGGKNILKTPLWVHKLVAFWGKGPK
ncbi:unnamed protein product, partial [Vitis vinifera]|uniref:Derlin n=1 Tax=Vitis vinifera TaxID=29760 RepID=D7U7D1_VITVI